MKKTLFSLLSAAALLWSTSCSDETIAPEVGGEGLVQFTVELNDGASASRAISDAGNISELYYEVWAYQNGQTTPVKTAIDAVEKKFSVVDGKKQFNVNFHLVKGQKYDVVFWAQSEGAYNADDLTQIAVTPADANDDTRDAFTAVYPIEKVDGSKSHKVTLRRPFAQVNFGVTGEDYDAAKAAGLDLSAETSSITVSNVATKYNALTTKADAPATDFTFSAKVLPTLEDADAEKLTIGNVDYKYLATAYVLVNGEKAENQADVVNLTMNLTTNLNEAITLSVPNAPIRRNYRTNVIGNLLTNQTDFTVVVDATFAGEENLNTPYFAIGETRYTTFAEALAAAQDGETITLVGDAKFETEANVHLFVVEGKNITIDLNGNTIVANIPDVTKNTAIFQVKKGAGLTIEGEGNIHLQTNKAVNVLAAFISNEGGVVNLKGGNWTISAYDSWEDALIPTFVDNNSTLGASTVNIYGGTYTFHRNLFRNFSNHKTEVATINIYGGTFNGKVDDAGAIWNQKPSASVPAGAGVICVEGGTFNNVIISDDFGTNGVVFIIENQEELEEAFNANADVIELSSDIVLNADWAPVGTVDAPFTGVINGNGKTISNLTVTNQDYCAFIAYAGEGTVIKNLTLENVIINSTKHAAGVVCIANDVTIENVKVSGEIVAASYAGGIYHNGANVKIVNCENNANVTANRAAGIGAWLTVNATIENVKNTGNITGAVGASGICHGFAGSIKNAVNEGNITSSNVEAAAGIAGVQKGASTYEYCYNYGDVTSTYDNVNASAAGILGQNPGSACTLKYCANYGKITAEQSYASGIAYSLYGQINASYCYNAGAVTGADGAGAIAAKAAFGTGDKANYCLNAGDVSSANGTVCQGANNNVSSYYYKNGELLNVADNSAVAVDAALALLNGGADKSFFKTENGVITVK